MRTKNINIAGRDIVIREMKIRDIKTNLMPKIGSAWESITNGEVSDVIDNLGAQMVEVFPELKGINIDECYPSEIETFVEAWIDVNFTGIKRMFGPVLSLVNQVPLKLG